MTTNAAGTLTNVGIGPQSLSEEVDHLITVIGRLAEVLLSEVAAVRANDRQKLPPLLEEKETLSAFYSRQMQVLGRHKSELAALGDPVIGRLKVAADALRAALEENARVLRVAKIAHEKVMKAIGDAVAVKTRPQVNYSKSGEYQTKVHAGAPEMRPIALDQEV